MKVPAVNFSSMSSPKYRAVNLHCSGNKDVPSGNGSTSLDIPYFYPVTFGKEEETGGQAKLRRLFAYRLPCMYSGAIMIDPKMLNRWLTTGLHNRPAVQTLEALAPYNDSFGGMEKRVLQLIYERAKFHPDKTVKQLLTDVEPVYKRRLRKVQAPIFMELNEAARNLPEQYRYQYKELMNTTANRLNEKPVVIPFSSYEFKYILFKINKGIQNEAGPKGKKAMKKIIKESQRFAGATTPQTIANQQKVLNQIENIINNSVLCENPALNELVAVSKSRLMQEEIIAPFSRKQFLYDLHKIIDKLPDEDLRNSMLDIAYKLPTSNENFAAYIVKIASLPDEKILHTIVWPYLASVEHLKPKSEGGDRHTLSNLGAARTTLNSERSSRDFRLWIAEHPETKINCQKYVDRLIELNKNGIFKKAGIPESYIAEFKQTIYNLSDGNLNLDITAMNK